MNQGWVSFLDAVEDVSRGNRKIQQRDLLPMGDLAVVDQGVSQIAGYTNDRSAQVNSEPPLLVFGDHTRVFKYVDHPFAMGADGVKVLRVRDGFDPRYVYHYLSSLQLPDAGYSRHYKFLKEVAVPRPLVEDQRRIAAILDQADAIRTKRRQVLDHLSALIGAAFDSRFGGGAYPMTSLDQVTLGGGIYGASVPSIDYRDDLPRYVRITDITDAGELNAQRRSPGGERDSWARHVLEDGDVLFARSGATVGKTYRYREQDGPSIYAGYLIRFRPDPLVLDPDYLFYFTKTPSYLAWVQARQNVVAQPNINAKQYGGGTPGSAASSV